MTMRAAVFAGALLTLTTGLAQDGANDPREIDIEGGAPPPKEDKEACFNVREARSFSALDDRFVYLEGPRDEHFVLTMFPGCIGLEDSIQIAISNELSRVCSIDTAEVTYRGLGGNLEACSIRRVEAVEDRAAAEALVESRKRAEE
jgi:Family of unknown function (DUF6491)